MKKMRGILLLIFYVCLHEAAGLVVFSMTSGRSSGLNEKEIYRTVSKYLND